MQQFSAALAAQFVGCHDWSFTVLAFQVLFSEHFIHHMLRVAARQGKPN